MLPRGAGPPLISDGWPPPAPREAPPPVKPREAPPCEATPPVNPGREPAVPPVGGWAPPNVEAPVLCMPPPVVVGVPIVCAPDGVVPCVTPPSLANVPPPVVGPCEAKPPVVGPCEADPPVVGPCEADPPVVGPCEAKPPVVGPCEADPPVVGPCEAKPPEPPEGRAAGAGGLAAGAGWAAGAGLGAGAGFLLSAAELVMLPNPRRRARIVAAAPLRMALRRSCIVIESSFPFQSSGSTLHSRSGNLLCEPDCANLAAQAAYLTLLTFPFVKVTFMSLYKKTVLPPA